MSLICGEAKGGFKVVQVAGKNKDTRKIEPTEVGWQKASAYHCFCDIHDSQIFKPIEDDNTFDFHNNEHLFLHTFRSFAYAYHKQRENIDRRHELGRSLLDAFSAFTNLFDNKNEDVDDRIQKSYDAEMYSFNLIRDRLIKNWQSKTMQGLKGLSIEIDTNFPFASAGTLMANIIDPNGANHVFFDPDQGHLVLPHPGIILTVFPVKENKTIIILTALSADQNAQFILERFDRLYEEDPKGSFMRAISGLMLSVNKENTFLHPKMWEAMKANGDAIKLQQDIESSRDSDLLGSTPWMPQVNMFSDEYTCYRLGIE